MKNLSFVTALLRFALFVIPGYCFAQSNATGQANVAQSARPIDTVFTPTQIPLIALHVLTLRGSDIIKQKGLNVVLNYYLDKNAVTLYGWTLNRRIPIVKPKGKFYDDKKILLTPIGKATNVTIGPKTLLGNQVILRSDVNNIVNKIKADPEQSNVVLVFTPEKQQSSKDANSTEIVYKIELVVLGRNGKRTIAQGFSTNPSPPHQNFD